MSDASIFAGVFWEDKCLHLAIFKEGGEPNIVHCLHERDVFNGRKDNVRSRYLPSLSIAEFMAVDFAQKKGGGNLARSFKAKVRKWYEQRMKGAKWQHFSMILTKNYSKKAFPPFAQVAHLIKRSKK